MSISAAASYRPAGLVSASTFASGGGRGGRDVERKLQGTIVVQPLPDQALGKARSGVEQACELKGLVGCGPGGETVTEPSQRRWFHDEVAE